MRCLRHFTIIGLCVLIAVVNCRTRCARIRGSVYCPMNKKLSGNVEVMLYDRDDLPWETDDLMGRNVTDSQGHFIVEGCGYDFGAWNDPEPFLVFIHACPSRTQLIQYPLITRQTKTEVRQTFLPNEVDVGHLHLDIEGEY
uniref:Transthyretin-like family protein n=1 Tax=Ascaris lumbricoides TaxID=6252 RepID=A0A0M3IET0_ASCLU